MTKQNNTIFWIIGIAIVIFLILPKLQIPKEEGIIGLTPHYYKDGVEVFPKFSLLSFSVVTPPGGSYNQISLDIIIKNNGTITFNNLRYENVAPLDPFAYVLPPLPSKILPGETKVVSSLLMNTSDFWGYSQPVRFWVNVSGVNEYTETREYNEAYLDLTIENNVEIIIEKPPKDYYKRTDSLLVSGQVYNDGNYYDSCVSRIQPDGFSQSCFLNNTGFFINGKISFNTAEGEKDFIIYMTKDYSLSKSYNNITVNFIVDNTEPIVTHIGSDLTGNIGWIRFKVIDNYEVNRNSASCNFTKIETYPDKSTHIVVNATYEGNDVHYCEANVSSILAPNIWVFFGAEDKAGNFGEG